MRIDAASPQLPRRQLHVGIQVLFGRSRIGDRDTLGASAAALGAPFGKQRIDESRRVATIVDERRFGAGSRRRAGCIEQLFEDKGATGIGVDLDEVHAVFTDVEIVAQEQAVAVPVLRGRGNVEAVGRQPPVRRQRSDLLHAQRKGFHLLLMFGREQDTARGDQAVIESGGITWLTAVGAQPFEHRCRRRRQTMTVPVRVVCLLWIHADSRACATTPQMSCRPPQQSWQRKSSSELNAAKSAR